MQPAFCTLAEGFFIVLKMSTFVELILFELKEKKW